jgi:chitin disaccharide deacetylase
MAHEHGIVTSASLMIRWPAANRAAAYARAHPHLSLGLHVEVGEWVFRNGSWTALYEVVPRQDEVAVYDEVSRQVEGFGRLVGRNPTHIDSHQHVHREEPLRSILLRIAQQIGVALREFSPDVHYVGEFYGQTAEGAPLPEFISVDHLVRLLEAVPPGLTELSCHPGLSKRSRGMYASERITEVDVLCDARVRTAIGRLGIVMRGF